MNVLIVEDVTLVADYIAELVQKHLNNCKITIAHTLTEATYCITEKIYDLVFLDLNLNGVNGFELLKSVSAESFQTIVITANREKAATAFDFGVLDFVSKPIIEERFKVAIDRFLNGIGAQREQLKYVTIKSKGRIQLIAIEEIEFIKASGNYAEIYTDEKRSFLHDKNLEKLIKILPKHFIRIHRSFIVNTTKIDKIHKHGGGKYSLELLSGERVALSRTMYKKYKANLEKR